MMNYVLCGEKYKWIQNRIDSVFLDGRESRATSARSIRQAVSQRNRNTRASERRVGSSPLGSCDAQGSLLKADGAMEKVIAGLNLILSSLVTTTTVTSVPQWATNMHNSSRGSRVDRETSQDMEILIPRSSSKHTNIIRLVNSCH